MIDLSLTWVRDHPWGLVIDGCATAAIDGDTYDTYDPSTGKLLACVPVATAADVDTAVEAANRVLPQWAEVSVAERAAILRRFADSLETHEEELALLDALDAGHPVSAMRFDVRLAADSIRRFADWGLALNGETM